MVLRPSQTQRRGAVSSEVVPELGDRYCAELWPLGLIVFVNWADLVV